MTQSAFIAIGGRRYRRFIVFPSPVTDGTVRCIFCGQIDEPEVHVDRDCPAGNPSKPAGGAP